MVSMCKVVKLGLNKMKFCSKTSKQNQNEHHPAFSHSVMRTVKKQNKLEVEIFSRHKL